MRRCEDRDLLDYGLRIAESGTVSPKSHPCPHVLVEWKPRSTDQALYFLRKGLLLLSISVQRCAAEYHPQATAIGSQAGPKRKVPNGTGKLVSSIFPIKFCPLLHDQAPQVPSIFIFTRIIGRIAFPCHATRVVRSTRNAASRSAG